MSEINSGTYTLDVKCSNCHFSKDKFEIPKGKKLDEIECPTCGNKKVLDEDYKPIQFNPYNNGYDV